MYLVGRILHFELSDSRKMRIDFTMTLSFYVNIFFLGAEGIAPIFVRIIPPKIADWAEMVHYL